MNRDQHEYPEKDRHKELPVEATSFLNNAQSPTSDKKSSRINIPSVTLPKGGGALKSIDEKFKVNAANGTATFAIPLPFSPGRNRFTPSLSLSYNSGSGNGIFGIGWSLDLPNISRKTDKKLPQYNDKEESDTFIFSGAEDLVPALKKDNNGQWIPDRFTINNKTVTRYRPRIESGFDRIEKVEEGDTVFWQVRSKENVVSIYGKEEEAKLISPVKGESYKVFKWYLQYSYDDKGNFIQYYYKKENLEGVPRVVHEQNRQSGNALCTNIFLKGVRYGNKVPYYEGDPLPDDFLFELILDYGEHDKDNPSLTESTPWLVRQDAFSEYKAGFEVRTYRLCHRALMFHHFPELGKENYLVQSMDFVYDETPCITYLTQAVSKGYIWNKDGSLMSKESIPPLEFSYYKPGFSREVKELSSDDSLHAPEGIDNRAYQWLDLYSEGISGILTEQSGGWFFKENLGNGEFTPGKLVSPKPSLAGLAKGDLTVQELDADGKKFLVSSKGDLKGYFELSLSEEWESFRPFEKYPNIDVTDPHLKYLDLNGDGKPDMLFSREQDFVWYASKGKEGYDDYTIASKEENEEKGPTTLYTGKDDKMLISTADMTGDGLPDIVMITHSEVFYYPNLGYGNFGAKVAMSMDGAFDAPDLFNPAHVHLADIDGSGTTDIVYTGKTNVEVWFNYSGNSLSEPSEFFNPFPELDNYSKISVIDLLGIGTSCLVWSSALPAHTGAPWRYIDMMGGRKPHVMYGYKNNSGKEVTLEYKSSAQFYLEDKKAGKKWATKLPFPVQCVSKVTVVDKVSQTRFVNEYTYHHGYYDTAEREFRGFALVVQKDTETYEHYEEGTANDNVSLVEKDLYQPAVITKSWFHTGAFTDKEVVSAILKEEYYPYPLLKNGEINDPQLVADLEKIKLSEPDPPAYLTLEENRECCRSLKGLPLRTEVFSDEGGVEEQKHPYTVMQHTYQTALLQPQQDQKYAVFFNHEYETLLCYYERNPADPRIAHTIAVEADPYGNPLEAVTIAYGRKKADVTLPEAGDQARQTTAQVMYTVNNYTEVIDDADYRLPVQCEGQTWELVPSPPEAALYTGTEIQTRFTSALIRQYQEQAGINEKRKTEHTKTLFFKNDLTGPKPFGFMDTRGLVYENYQLAFTPFLLQEMYGNRWNDSLLRSAGGYVSLEDSNYWIRSGIMWYHPDLNAIPYASAIPPATPADLAFAKNNFFLPVAYEDSTGKLTKVFYDAHKLLIVKSIDPLKNETSVTRVNYRLVLPVQLQDANANRSAVRFNALGLVTHVFVLGKAGAFEGDLFDFSSIEISDQDQPSTIIEYDFRYHTTAGAFPDTIKTREREKHYYQQTQPGDIEGGVAVWLEAFVNGSINNSAVISAENQWHYTYAYLDGSGKEVLRKIQAEPGLAPLRNASGALVLSVEGNVQQSDTSPALRWIGNGRTIYNNKGKPVKQYEPFFDSTFEYNWENELTMLGFTPLFYYDATGRNIKTIYPDSTYSAVEYQAWEQTSYDRNDTVTQTAWYSNRMSGSLGNIEKEIAEQTSVHAGTPLITYTDALGRSIMTRAHNATQRSGEQLYQEYYYTRTELDAEGNVRSIRDPRNNEVMTWKYDMLGNICYQQSVDAGDRWMLKDVSGKQIRLWDSRSQELHYEYDDIHRLLLLRVIIDEQEFLYEKYEYGESHPEGVKRNLRGKVYRQYDTGGILTSYVYDFKGNILAGSRQLPAAYNAMPDWNNAVILDSVIYYSGTAYDGLNRPSQVVSPDQSVLQFTYNASGLPDKANVKIKGALLATAFITNINYNAKGQREKIQYGNGTITRYDYEPDTYRLSRLLTTASNGSNILQDLNYRYDPVGNIVRQSDHAQKTVFYGGQQIDAENTYLYDAIYRLIESSGREHIGQTGTTAADNWDDSWSRLYLQPNSPVQLRNYSQKYIFDPSGNIRMLQHIAGAGSWTREYLYPATGNRLQQCSVSGQTYSYSYNPHGSILTMPHWQGVAEWNFREELLHLSLGGGGEAWYMYDSKGQRLRKVIERPGGVIEERIYLGSFEVYRERTGNGVTLERETLHVTDGKQRIAMVETRTVGNDNSQSQLIRYQYTDHLGSSCLELDDSAKIITYEEYHPFGTTAYQATDAFRQVPSKRYRYTGMERDEESGLGYHTTRYYIPWLGRWLSADPKGITDGLNLFSYVSNNPVKLIDKTGTDGLEVFESKEWKQQIKEAKEIDILRVNRETVDNIESDKVLKREYHDGNIGLAKTENVKEFVKLSDQLRSDWEKLTPEQRKQRLLDMINTMLRKENLPEVTLEEARPEDSSNFTADANTWGIFLNGLEQQLAMDNPNQFVPLITTLYHEARHSEQVFRAIKYAQSMNQPAHPAPERILQEAGLLLKKGTPEFKMGELHHTYEAGAKVGFRNEVYNQLAIAQKRLAEFDANTKNPTSPAAQEMRNKLVKQEMAAYEKYEQLPAESDSFLTMVKVFVLWNNRNKPSPFNK